jgi:chromosome segregation ATPase
MEEHYLTQQHQDAILKVVHQMQSQLLDSQMDTDLPRTTTAATSETAVTQLQEIRDALDILSGGMNILNGDAQRLSNDSLQSRIHLQALAEKFSQVKVSVEESHIFLQEVQHNQDILNQDLSSLKENINDMPSISYDGSFVWKISNFQEKMST